MTAILYILLAIVIAVAIWQVTSIFNLKGAIATEKDNNTQGILFALFGWIIVLSMAMDYNS